MQTKATYQSLLRMAQLITIHRVFLDEDLHEELAHMIRFEHELDGITTREVFIDTTPEAHRHLDSAGMLTLDGFIALSRDMRLDDVERRELQ